MKAIKRLLMREGGGRNLKNAKNYRYANTDTNTVTDTDTNTVTDTVTDTITCTNTVTNAG